MGEKKKPEGLEGSRKNFFCQIFEWERLGCKRTMMARRVWETLKREGACEKFEVRGSGDQWGLYCTEVDQVRDRIRIQSTLSKITFLKNFKLEALPSLCNRPPSLGRK